MEKIRPSEKISNEISELLKKGCSETEDFLTVLIRKSVKKIVQEILEQEITDYLGREYYERKAESNAGQRNGYESKQLKTAEGKLKIEIPQLRNTEEPFKSPFMSQIESLTPELKRLATEMYVRGLSTRDIQDTFIDENGRPFISKDGVSQITEALSEEYQRFSERDLSGYDVVYLFVDGVYERLRLNMGAKEALLCAWAILSNGHKVLLHIALGNKESYECWRDFFRDMISRGLRMPLLVTSDGAPGLIRAIQESFSKSKRQRCMVHKLKNISNKLPKNVIHEVMPKIKNVYYQTNREVALIAAKNLIDEYADKYPSAIKCFQEDLDSCLVHMEFPVGHHRYIRTTNLLERAFEEQKRRTKVIPRFFDEKSCLKLIYATLIRVSDKWRRISMNELDLTLLKNLRKLYGFDEPESDYISMKLAA